MRLAALSILAMAILPACGKKAAPEAAAETAEAPAPAPSAALTVKMPSGGDAKSFAKAMVDVEVTNFKPAGAGSSVQFVYKTMDFKADGTWTADASVEANFEEIPCKENGIWSIADVESPKVGTISWTVEKTNCAMREGGESTRGQVTLGKGTGFQVAFR